MCAAVIVKSSEMSVQGNDSSNLLSFEENALVHTVIGNRRQVYIHWKFRRSFSVVDV